MCPGLFLYNFRYRNGIRGHMKSVVQDLLRMYLRVETKFQQGPYDKCVMSLRDEFKSEMETVVWSIFSHSQISKKNQLVVQIIVSWSVLLSGWAYNSYIKEHLIILPCGMF